MDGDRDTQVDRDVPERDKRSTAAESNPRRSRRSSNNGGDRPRQNADAEPDNVVAKGVGRSDSITQTDLNALLAGLRDLRGGDFEVRLPRSRHPLMADIVSAFNDVASRNEQMAKELGRISDIVGRKGDMTARVSLDGMTGGWAQNADALNSLVTDLVARRWRWRASSRLWRRVICRRNGARDRREVGTGRIPAHRHDREHNGRSAERIRVRGHAR